MSENKAPCITEPAIGYNSFSYAPVEYVFRLYEELGATVYNLEV